MYTSNIRITFPKFGCQKTDSLPVCFNSYSCVWLTLLLNRHRRDPKRFWFNSLEHRLHRNNWHSVSYGPILEKCVNVHLLCYILFESMGRWAQFSWSFIFTFIMILGTPNSLKPNPKNNIYFCSSSELNNIYSTVSYFVTKLRLITMI